MTYNEMLESNPWWKMFNEFMNKYFDHWIYVWLNLYYQPFEQMGKIANNNICKNK